MINRRGSKRSNKTPDRPSWASIGALNYEESKNISLYISICVAFFCIYMVFKAFHSAYMWLLDSPSEWRILFYILLVVTTSIVVFILKQKWRFWYGWAEFMFGLIGCFVTASYLSDSKIATVGEMETFISLVVPIFIIGRAMDNIVKGCRRPWRIFVEVPPGGTEKT